MPIDTDIKAGYGSFGNRPNDPRKKDPNQGNGGNKPFSPHILTTNYVPETEYDPGDGKEDIVMSEALASAAPEQIEPEEEQKKQNWFQNLFTTPTPSEQLMTKIDAMHPRFRNQLLKGLFGDEFDEGDFGQIDTDAALEKLSGMTSSLESAYDTSNLSGAEILSALQNPDMYGQAAMAGYLGPNMIGSLGIPLKGAGLLYGDLMGETYNLNAAMGPFDVDLAPYQGDVSNFNPGMMDKLKELQGDFTPLQEGQYISGNLMNQSDWENTKGTQDRLQDAQIQLTSPGEQLSELPFTTGSTAEEQIDYQALYNQLSPVEKQTADKILAMDEYDTAYAVNYIMSGGPLF